MSRQHHRCNEHELGQSLGVGEGQGGLACCRPWGRKELDTTGRQTTTSLKKWEPHHITCLLRNLYANQEATVRTGHGTMDWFKIGKGVCQGCVWSPCLEYIMPNARLESRLPREISVTLDMQMITT